MKSAWRGRLGRRGVSPYARLLGAAGLYPSAIFVRIRDGGDDANVDEKRRCDREAHMGTRFAKVDEIRRWGRVSQGAPSPSAFGPGDGGGAASEAVARCARPDRPTAGLHDGWPAVAPSALLTGTADRAPVNGPVELTTRGRTARFSCLWALPAGRVAVPGGSVALSTRGLTSRSSCSWARHSPASWRRPSSIGCAQ